MEDRCVVCGQEIPEGRIVCINCIDNFEYIRIISDSIAREIDLFAHKYGDYPKKIFMSHPLFNMLDLHYRYLSSCNRDGLIAMFEGILVVPYASTKYEFYLSGHKGTFYNIQDNDRIFIKK